MRSISRYAAACVLTLATLTGAASAASAASGSGGGGGGGGGGTGGAGCGTTTTATNGAIRAVSAAAVCDAGSTIGITLDKGFDKRVEVQVAYSGMPAGEQTTYRLTNDADGSLIAGWGSFPSSPSALITILGRTVPPGTVEISAEFQLTAAATGEVLETCTAHISTFAK